MRCKISGLSVLFGTIFSISLINSTVFANSEEGAELPAPVVDTAPRAENGSVSPGNILSTSFQPGGTAFNDVEIPPELIKKARVFADASAPDIYWPKLRKPEIRVELDHHRERVEYYAVKYAHRFGLDPDKVQPPASQHDITKYYALAILARFYQVHLDEFSMEREIELLRENFKAINDLDYFHEVQELKRVGYAHPDGTLTQQGQLTLLLIELVDNADRVFYPQTVARLKFGAHPFTVTMPEFGRVPYPVRSAHLANKYDFPDIDFLERLHDEIGRDYQRISATDMFPIHIYKLPSRETVFTCRFLF